MRSPRSVYGAGAWEVDVERGELKLRGVPVVLGARAFDILAVLVESAGELVTKDQLMSRVWQDSIVEESRLHVHISAIRKALGSDRDLVKTMSGRGYRILGDWRRREGAAATRGAPADAAQGRQIRSNVPMSGPALIGRASAVETVQGLLSVHRVVTLTGPGGIGKTALALDVARSLLPTFEGDIQSVDLVTLSDPGLVPSAVASALKLTMGGDEVSNEDVARVIGERRLLLVLDNCDHVIDAAARLSEAVVRLCPQISVLATSIEVLRVRSEYVYRVPPLDAPPENEHEREAILKYGAVQLLLARIAAQAEFSLQDAQFPAITSICRRLDGIPLAIEFAAARAATFGVEEVAARLQDRFALLTQGWRTALPRHQTLRAVLDWSHELLPEAARAVLRRLSTFTGSFTLESAIAVAGDGTIDVAPAVASLAAKSLISTDVGVMPVQYRLLESTRAYATEKLVESGELNHYRRLHAQHHLDWFTRAAANYGALAISEFREAYCHKIDELRRALDWAFSPNGDESLGVALTVTSIPVWLTLSLTYECRERVERALASLATKPMHSERDELKLLMTLGLILPLSPRPLLSDEDFWGRALSLAERLGDDEASGEILYQRATVHWYAADFRKALALAEKSSAAGERGRYAHLRMRGNKLVGLVLHQMGEHTKALDYIDPIVKQPVHPSQIVMFGHRMTARQGYASILWSLGFPDQAVANARMALDEALLTTNPMTISYILAHASFPIAFHTGDFVEAERSVAMLIDYSATSDTNKWNQVARCQKGQLLLAQGDFGGLPLLRSGLDWLHETGFDLYCTMPLGPLARGMAASGEAAAALLVIEGALQRADSTEERSYIPELLRIKGEIFEADGASNAGSQAEDCFIEALSSARGQDALSWELRAAMSLARLWKNSGQSRKADDLLRPLFGRFTEGFQTLDLKAAKCLLDELTQSKAPAHH